jgi:thiamine-monophosphate kinase
MTEFELIRRFFVPQPVVRDDVVLGVGDDAAVVAVPSGHELVITTDTLVAGRHFLPDADPDALGHRALAVNLSDLAAMGAAPAWCTLSLTLPQAEPAWLEAFCAGFYVLARRYRVQLIGGNLARGPMSITVAAHGFVPQGQALQRRGAKAGDLIYVTGTLGDAAAALQARLGRLALPPESLAQLAPRLDRPEPRLDVGARLRGVASSVIDISDGLLADLGHILEASGVGARIERERLPLSPVYREHLERIGWDAALSGGDDYELCFTVPRASVDQLDRVAAEPACAVTPIGEVTAEPGLTVLDAHGVPVPPTHSGYNHFSTQT